MLKERMSLEQIMKIIPVRKKYLAELYLNFDLGLKDKVNKLSTTRIIPKILILHYLLSFMDYTHNYHDVNKMRLLNDFTLIEIY